MSNIALKFRASSSKGKSQQEFNPLVSAFFCLLRESISLRGDATFVLELFFHRKAWQMLTI